LHEVTGLPVIAAFDSGNLLDVARSVRDRDPARPIVIAADNDHHLPRLPSPLPNVGLEKAVAAAEVIGGVVLSPTFAPGAKGTDWNDYAAQHGTAALRALAAATLRSRGIELPERPRPSPGPRAAEASTSMTQAERDVARRRLRGGSQTAAPGSVTREAARQTQRERPPRATP
jgi:phage/plasmid primase-like uncharacterized protein